MSTEVKNFNFELIEKRTKIIEKTKNAKDISKLATYHILKSMRDGKNIEPTSHKNLVRDLLDKKIITDLERKELDLTNIDKDVIPVSKFETEKDFINYINFDREIYQEEVCENYKKEFVKKFKDISEKNFIIVNALPSLLPEVDDDYQKDNLVVKNISDIINFLGQFYNYNNQRISLADRSLINFKIGKQVSYLFQNNIPISTGYKMYYQDINWIKRPGLENTYDIILPLRFLYSIRFGNKSNLKVRIENNNDFFADFEKKFTLVSKTETTKSN